jgi:hypothetical protein
MIGMTGDQISASALGPDLDPMLGEQVTCSTFGIPSNSRPSRLVSQRSRHPVDYLAVLAINSGPAADVQNTGAPGYRRFCCGRFVPSW